MYNYNVDIIKTNIKKLMKDRNISQVMLADAIGISQARVSACLKINEKDVFTFEQMINIANVFEVSVDDIVGVEKKSHRVERTMVTMADFADLFYEFYRALSFYMEIREITDEYEKEHGTIVEVESMGITFFPDLVDAFLAEFRDVATATDNIVLKEKFLNLWIKDYKEKCENLGFGGEYVERLSEFPWIRKTPAKQLEEAKK